MRDFTFQFDIFRFSSGLRSNYQQMVTNLTRLHPDKELHKLRNWKQITSHVNSTAPLRFFCIPKVRPVHISPPDPDPGPVQVWAIIPSWQFHFNEADQTETGPIGLRPCLFLAISVLSWISTQRRPKKLNSAFTNYFRAAVRPAFTLHSRCDQQGVFPRSLVCVRACPFNFPSVWNSPRKFVRFRTLVLLQKHAKPAGMVHLAVNTHCLRGIILWWDCGKAAEPKKLFSVVRRSLPTRYLYNDFAQ